MRISDKVNEIKKARKQLLYKNLSRDVLFYYKTIMHEIYYGK